MLAAGPRAGSGFCSQIFQPLVQSAKPKATGKPGFGSPASGEKTDSEEGLFL
jgi:hypothetical protein